MGDSKRGLVIALSVVSVALLLVAGCMGYYIWWQGKQAQAAAKLLLEQQASQAAQEKATPSVLRIESISLELPILWDYDEKLLETTICRYRGPDPGEDGNLIITGHDFLNGAHFGKLDKVKKGDQVVVYDEEGKEFSYTVYDSVVIKPDEVTALEEYEGDSALTLMTCTENANKRLLVKCKLVEETQSKTTA